jgi:hypothetical protein
VSWDFRELAYSAVSKSGDRIKVRISPSTPPPLEGESPQGTFSELKWSQKKLAHGGEVDLSAKVKDLPAGANVRFIVESEQDGNWLHYAAVPGEVNGGSVTGTLLLEDALPDKARLRFRVQLGKAKARKKA